MVCSPPAVRQRKIDCKQGGIKRLLCRTTLLCYEYKVESKRRGAITGVSSRLITWKRVWLRRSEGRAMRR